MILHQTHQTFGQAVDAWNLSHPRDSSSSNPTNEDANAAKIATGIEETANGAKEEEEDEDEEQYEEEEEEEWVS